MSAIEKDLRAAVSFSHIAKAIESFTFLYPLRGFRQGIPSVSTGIAKV